MTFGKIFTVAMLGVSCTALTPLMAQTTTPADPTTTTTPPGDDMAPGTSTTDSMPAKSMADKPMADKPMTGESMPTEAATTAPMETMTAAPAPQAQRVYPPCSATLQDQCMSRGQGVDQKMARKPMRKRTPRR